jgi:hypothetical protein
MADVSDEVGNARTVLLCAPSLAGGERAACNDLLLAEDSAATSVLWVTFRRDARACVDQWVELADDDPRQGAVIAVGDTGEAVDVEWATVETVSSASDLTGVSIELAELLADWAGQLVVCFDSVTAMLQYVDFETAFEFIHTVTGQLYAANARAHFHIDPTAHDEETVAAIASLFDATVTIAEGKPSIRTRDLLA